VVIIFAKFLQYKPVQKGELSKDLTHGCFEVHNELNEYT